jgi:hypothetical protein
MMAAQVQFSNYTVNPRDLLVGRVVAGPINPAWRRVRFEADHTAGVREQINRWLAANMNERWALSMTMMRFGEVTVVVAFESDVDAVMFRLKGGETAWTEAPVIEV